MLFIDFNSKEGLRNAVLGHVLPTQVATCCIHWPRNEPFVGRKFGGFFGHSRIFLLPHVAPLLFLVVRKGTVRCDLRVRERLRAESWQLQVNTSTGGDCGFSPGEGGTDTSPEAKFLTCRD